MSLPRADPAEAHAFLAAHPHVRTIDLVFTNMAGVPRGKRLRTHELVPFFESGRFLPGSILANDTLGRDVPETGLVWADGDADRLAWPAPGTLAPTPWADGAAQVLASLHELDGTPCALDPRAILADEIAALVAMGFTPVVACELEFYLLDPGANYASPPPGMAHPQVYALDEDTLPRGFTDAVNAAGDAMGLPVEAAISEYAPGQLEVGLIHRADALRACDEAVAFKRMVKGVARGSGFEATFMAKPYAHTSGSGLHIHLSLADADGGNAMASDDPAGSPVLARALGGMRAWLPQSMAVFAPGANSYRRFRAASYAPVGATWGINNRSVALRVPAGPPGSRHIEHRVAGADANPYLAVAAVLAATRHGIAAKLDPGPPVAGDGYAPDALARAPALPTDWLAAIDAFAAGPLFAPAIRSTYATIKRCEHRDYHFVVPPMDHEWYRSTA